MAAMEPDDIVLLRRISKTAPTSFRPSAMTDAAIIAFDPTGDRLLALSDAGLVKLLGEPLMNHETAEGKYGEIVVAGLTAAGRQALASYEPPEAKTIAVVRNRLASFLTARKRAFKREFAEFEDKQETYYLNPFVPGTRDVIEDELRRRGAMALDVWLRAAADQNKVFTTAVGELAREDLTRMLGVEAADLREIFCRRAVLDRELPESDFVSLVESIAPEFVADIEYAVLTEGRVSRPGTVPTRHVEIQDRRINIHGPVYGTVVSGDQASIKVRFKITQQSRDDYASSLDGLRQVAERLDGLGEQQREELLETVDAALSEGRKRSPNRLKIAGLLQAIATTIQTLGASPEAWRLIELAAAAFGLETR